MTTGCIFERLQKHPLLLRREGSKAPESFVHGWNDALYISLSVRGLPGAVGAWCPAAYRDGWASCRALLEATSKGVRHVGEFQSVVAPAAARLS